DATHTCKTIPQECAAAGAVCGYLTDSCNTPISCGKCPNGEVCDATTHQCEQCRPLTQADCAGKCGTLAVGCGQSGTINCGGCTGGKTCNSTSHTCGCTPQTKCAAGVCGDLPDGCGGTLHCGACPLPQERAGHCGGIWNACGNQK